MPSHILSWITFFPLIGAAVILLLPSSREKWVKWVGLAATLPLDPRTALRARLRAA